MYTYLQYNFNTFYIFIKESKTIFSAELRIIQESRKKLKGGRRGSKKKLNISKIMNRHVNYQNLFSSFFFLQSFQYITEQTTRFPN